MSADLDLEEEIRIELERLEEIFNEESQIESPKQVSSAGRPSRLSYSAFEYAEAESEKEVLEDRLNLLLSKTEDCHAQIEYLTKINTELNAKNSQLLEANEKLRTRAGISTKSSNMITEQDQADIESKTNLTSEPLYECYGSLSQGSIALELLLSETRAKLSRMEAAYRDVVVSRDMALQELEKERNVRIHVGEFCILFYTTGTTVYITLHYSTIYYTSGDITVDLTVLSCLLV